MNVRRIAALLRELADELDRGAETDDTRNGERRNAQRRRRGGRAPTPVEKAVEVSPLNRARARDALRKRGYDVPRGTDEDR